jgi:site-specific recombinase XerD
MFPVVSKNFVAVLLQFMATKFKRGEIWYIRYKDSTGAWKSVSCSSRATATDAETIRKNYDAQELNRIHRATVRIVTGNLAANLTEYRDNEIPKSLSGRPKSTRGIKRYQALINNFIEYMVNHSITEYSQVTPDKADNFIQLLIRPPLSRSASTISKHRQTLAAFWRWSMAQNYCTTNPWESIRNPRREKKIPRFYSEDELTKIFAAAKPPYRAVFQFLYLTGLRIGELGNLEWSDYIEAQRYIIIRVMEGNKTKREEIVPLNDDAVKILNEQERISHYIFLNEAGRKLDNANIYRALLVVQKRCGITGASPHTFRHSCASHLAIKGVSLYVIKDILRHASIRETEIYAHLSRDSVRSAICLLSTPKPPTT